MEAFYSPDELQELKDISLKKDHDSKFIRLGLRYGYKRNLFVLKERSMTGRKGCIRKIKDGSTVDCSQKQQLTPEKVKVLKHLFNNRMNRCKSLGVNDFVSRRQSNYIHKLFSANIKYLSKTSFEEDHGFLVKDEYPEQCTEEYIEEYVEEFSEE